jgi:hypothetical protein
LSKAGNIFLSISKWMAVRCRFFCWPPRLSEFPWGALNRGPKFLDADTCVAEVEASHITTRIPHNFTDIIVRARNQPHAPRAYCCWDVVVVAIIFGDTSFNRNNRFFSRISKNMNFLIKCEQQSIITYFILLNARQSCPCQCKLKGRWLWDMYTYK